MSSRQKENLVNHQLKIPVVVKSPGASFSKVEILRKSRSTVAGKDCWEIAVVTEELSSVVVLGNQRCVKFNYVIHCSRWLYFLPPFVTPMKPSSINPHPSVCRMIRRCVTHECPRVDVVDCGSSLIVHRARTTRYRFHFPRGHHDHCLPELVQSSFPSAPVHPFCDHAGYECLCSSCRLPPAANAIVSFEKRRSLHASLRRNDVKEKPRCTVCLFFRKFV